MYIAIRDRREFLFRIDDNDDDNEINNNKKKIDNNISIKYFSPVDELSQGIRFPTSQKKKNHPILFREMKILHKKKNAIFLSTYYTIIIFIGYHERRRGSMFVLIYVLCKYAIILSLDIFKVRYYLFFGALLQRSQPCFSS